jgi:DNA repair protein RadA/Sms
MAKQRTQFLCNSCGSVHPKWMGKCPDCGTWDALQEYKAPTEDRRAPVLKNIDGDITRGAEAVAVADITDADIPRYPTGIGEFDRILGGGVVPGSAVLVGGEPGIGKSTLLLQVAHELAKQGSGFSGQGSVKKPGPFLPLRRRRV